MSLLRTVNLTKEFGGLTAVDDVDLSIEEGRFHAIIGPNGAGKTTFFNLLSGTLEPTSGEVYFHDTEISGLRPYERSQLGIGRSFQVTEVFSDISVLENVRLAARSRDYSIRSILFEKVTDSVEKNEEARGVLEQVGLGDKLDIAAGNLSHGDARRLDIAMAIATDPELLLLDEPTAGLPSEEAKEIVSLLEEFEDITVLLIEHRMSVVISLSDVITVLHRGEVLVEGQPQSVQDDERVQQIYLGEA